MSHGGARKGAGRPKGKEPTKAVRLSLNLINTVKQMKDTTHYQLPLYGSKVPAGLPSSSTDDHIESYLDLNEYLIKNPATTFFVRVSGHSMIGAGIHENDILIVDRKATPTNGKIIVAAIDGQLTVKRLQTKQDGKLFLIPENPNFAPIEIKESNEVYIWGVVTNVIHSV